MRYAIFATLCVAALGACKSTSPNDTKSQIVLVEWMDWPAEVSAGQHFRARMVVPGLCAVAPQFHDGVHTDPLTVTFRPYFTFESIAYCAQNDAEALFVAFWLDTAGIAPGLAPRDYLMQARSGGFTENFEPIMTFGGVLVRSAAPDTSRRNAGGWITTSVDSVGCRRIVPRGLSVLDATLVLDNQGDTTTLAGHFVQGYIYQAPTPICGETRVFHLESRN